MSTAFFMTYFIAMIILKLMEVDSSAEFIMTDLNDNSQILTNDPEPKEVHSIVIALKQNNLDLLEKELISRTNPESKVYQKWLTFDEIGVLSTNHDGFTNVFQWLTMNQGIKITHVSKRKEYVVLSAEINKWEELFDAKFQTYTHESGQGNDHVFNSKNTFIRASA